MSEQQKYYDGDFPCSLAGTGRCCRERHGINVKTRIDQGSKTVEIDDEPKEIKWQPTGREKLFVNWGIWQTHLEYDQKLIAELARKAAHTDKNKMVHYLDIGATRTAVHTPVSPDCPLLELLRQHKT